MLPIAFLDRLVPPRGCLLIRRDERSAFVRGLWIPDRARTSARAATATVIRVSPEIRELAPGDRVLLAATVGARTVRLGTGGEVIAVVEVCRPAQVLARIVSGSDDATSRPAAFENRGEHAFAAFTPAEIAGILPIVEPPAEGDPFALA